MALALALLVLSKFGVLHKLFGKALRDFQSGNSLKSNLDIVNARLSKWNKGANPSIRKADERLALWGGESWTAAGFFRCLAVALTYPLAFFWVYWLATGTGTLGAATVLPVGVKAEHRWAMTLATIGFFAWAWLCAAFAYGKQRSIEPLKAIPWMGLRLSKWAARGNYAGLALVAWVAFVGGFAALSAAMGAVVLAVGIGVGLTDAAAAPLAVAAVVVVVVVGAFAGAFAGVFAGFAFFVAGAGAGVFGGAVAIGGSLGGAVAGFYVVVYAVLIVFAVSQRRALPGSFVSVARVFAAWLGVVALSAWLLPKMPSLGVPLDTKALSAASPSFIFLLFFGFAPLLNGLSDWLSVNITRSLLQRYLRQAPKGAVQGWQFHLADIGSALLLTVALYATMLLVLWWMQHVGWQISVVDMLEELHKNPWTGSSQWLLLMAMTNLLPTLYHLGLWIAAKAWARDPSICSDLQDAMAKMATNTSAGVQLPARAMLCGEGAAQLFVHVLKIQPWIERLLVFGFAVFAVVAFTQAVPSAAGVMLGVLR